MTAGVYVLSCRLTSDPLWLGIYVFLWWFLLVIFGLFLLHWRYELPCQDKLPEFHSTPILGCIRILWLVSHPLGLGLDKALWGWNSVKEYALIPVNICKLQRDMVRRCKDRMIWMCACGRFDLYDYLPSIIHPGNRCCGEA